MRALAVALALVVCSLLGAEDAAASGGVSPWILRDASRSVSGALQATPAESDDPATLAGGASWQVVAPSGKLPRSPTGAVWLRFALVNETSSTAWVLTFRTANNHEELRVYLPGAAPIVTGALTPPSARAWGGPTLAVPLALEPDVTHEVLLYLETSSRFWSNDFLVMQERRYQQLENREAALFALYLGITFFALVISFTYALRLGDRSQAHYALYCFVWFVNVLAYQGFWTAYVTPESPAIGLFLDRLTIFAVPMVFLLFWRNVLELRRIAPRLDKLVTGLLVLHTPVVVMHALELAPGNAIRPWFAALSFVELVVATLALALAARAGIRLWRYYALALACVGLVVLLVVGAVAGLVPQSIPLYLIYTTMQTCEIVILTIAMAERHRLVQAERDEALVQSRDAATLRSLLQVVTHDLANQVQAIELALGRLRVRATDSWLGELSTRLDKLTAHMREIIEHVRTIHALREGKRLLSLEPVRMGDVLEAVRVTFEDALIAKTLTLETEGAPADLEARALTDRVALTHNVLGNLVSNAIKFSRPGGRIVLAVRAERGAVTVSCRDEGIGMSPELMTRVFDPGAPTTRRGTQGEQGSGFGLPLVATFVDRMGGTLHVRSTDSGPESGTTVTVRLRRAP